MSEQFSFSDLRDLIANANEEKSGDRCGELIAVAGQHKLNTNLFAVHGVPGR
jgi:ethanolamine ammonia-lyase large subunit